MRVNIDLDRVWEATYAAEYSRCRGNFAFAVECADAAVSALQRRQAEEDAARCPANWNGHPCTQATGHDGAHRNGGSKWWGGY